MGVKDWKRGRSGSLTMEQSAQIQKMCTLYNHRLGSRRKHLLLFLTQEYGHGTQRAHPLILPGLSSASSFVKRYILVIDLTGEHGFLLSIYILKIVPSLLGMLQF